MRPSNPSRAIKRYGRTENDASTAKAAASICPIASGRKYSNGREQGWGPKRREEIGDHPGGPAIRRNARRRALRCRAGCFEPRGLKPNPACGTSVGGVAFKHASEIKATAKGCRGCSGSEAWGTFESFAQGSLQTDGEIDDGKTAPRFRQDEAQEAAHQKEPQEVVVPASLLSAQLRQALQLAGPAPSLDGIGDFHFQR